MSPSGLAAFEQVHQLLIVSLLAVGVAGVTVVGLAVAWHALTAAGSRLRLRRQALHADARLHAEAEHGIEDLERYLARR